MSISPVCSVRDFVHPCGNFFSDQKPCTCAPATVMKYQKRISGPILDRIDIHVLTIKDSERIKLFLELLSLMGSLIL